MNYKTRINMRVISVVLVLFMTVTVFGVLSYFDGEEIFGATSTGTVNAGPLNVRSGAGTNYKIMGQLSKGTEVSITGTKTGTDKKKWYAIKYKGKTGYVSSRYITLKSASGSQSSGSSAKKSTKTASTGTVNAGPLNVRSGAGTGYKIIGQLSKGTEVSITGTKTGTDKKKWYAIRYKGKTGYVSSRYVTLKSEGAAKPAAEDSKLTLSNATKPTTIKKGSSFVLRGNIKSKYKMNNVMVGIKNSSGKWISGNYISVNPNSTSYDISGADASIKFGTLAEGKYTYCIYAKDVKGYGKYLLQHSFTVTDETSSSVVTGSMGTTLSYKSSVINAIGKQPYSGPCGIYSMAYCRAILDGKFTKGTYSSIHERIIEEYGNGTNYAYWYKAGGTSTYYSSNRSCYRDAISQINMGRPCILLVHNGYTGNTHYITIVGYTKGTTESNVALSRLIALDPAYGTLKYLSNMKYYDHSTAQLVKF